MGRERRRRMEEIGAAADTGGGGRRDVYTVRDWDGCGRIFTRAFS
jgi:hypothetical protein